MPAAVRDDRLRPFKGLAVLAVVEAPPQQPPVFDGLRVRIELGKAEALRQRRGEAAVKRSPSRPGPSRSRFSP